MAKTPNTSPLTSLDSFQVERYDPGAFAGGSANARGDFDGTGNPHTLFTVTGDVIVRVYGVCTTNLAGATATLEVGVSGNTAEIIAQSTGTDIDAGDIWVDGTVDDVRAAVFSDVIASVLVTNSSNIIETVGTANMTSGQLYYVCLWRPVTSGSNVAPGS